jgi:hypothetical protein
METAGMEAMCSFFRARQKDPIPSLRGDLDGR